MTDWWHRYPVSFPDDPLCVAVAKIAHGMHYFGIEYRGEAASVYAIAGERGVKIGFSKCPESRCKQIGGDHVICTIGFPTRSRALHVERRIHWELRDKHLGEEWFDMSRDEAVAIFNLCRGL